MIVAVEADLETNVMQRTSLNLAIDIALAALFLAMAATGYLLFFPLPPSSNKNLTLWGLSRHQWGEIHFCISLVLTALLALHLVLHWSWLISVVKKRLGMDAHGSVLPSGLLSVLVLGGLFSAFAWISHASVREKEESACSAADPKIEKRNQTDGTPAVLTWAEVNPLLQRSCASCHGPTQQRGGIRVDRRADLVGGDEPLVIPGDADHSRLLAIVSGLQPIALPQRHRLSDADIKLVRDWIISGAL